MFPIASYSNPSLFSGPWRGPVRPPWGSVGRRLGREDFHLSLTHLGYGLGAKDENPEALAINEWGLPSGQLINVDFIVV